MSKLVNQLNLTETLITCPTHHNCGSSDGTTNPNPELSPFEKNRAFDFDRQLVR